MSDRMPHNKNPVERARYIYFQYSLRGKTASKNAVNDFKTSAFYTNHRQAAASAAKLHKTMPNT